MFDIKTFTPYRQLVLVAGLALIVMTGAKLLQILNITVTNPEKIWILSATFALFYAVANCVLSLNEKETDQYWNQSMIAFAMLMVLLGAAAWLLTGISINNMGSFRWMYIVIVVSYIVFSTITRMMRNIVDYAQKEEWNQPKKRKK